MTTWLVAAAAVVVAAAAAAAAVVVAAADPPICCCSTQLYISMVHQGYLPHTNYYPCPPFRPQPRPGCNRVRPESRCNPPAPALVDRSLWPIRVRHECHVELVAVAAADVVVAADVADVVAAAVVGEIAGYIFVVVIVVDVVVVVAAAAAAAAVVVVVGAHGAVLGSIVCCYSLREIAALSAVAAAAVAAVFVVDYNTVTPSLSSPSSPSPFDVAAAADAAVAWTHFDSYDFGCFPQSRRSFRVDSCLVESY